LTEITKEIQDFIDDFASMPFDANYFYSVYGEPKVKEWMSNPDISTAIKRRIQQLKREAAKKETLLIENWGMLRNKAFENLVSCLNDKTHKDNIKVSMWITDGEHSYVKARAEEMGKKAATTVASVREPLRILKGDDADKETS
jgi:hypothetical protein